MFDTVKELVDEIKNTDDMPVLLMINNNEAKIFMQYFMRPIDGVEIKLFGLWNIQVNEEHRNKGIFRSIIEALESKPYPVIVNDIVNPMVKDYLVNRGWKLSHHQKSGYREVEFAYMLKGH